MPLKHPWATTFTITTGLLALSLAIRWATMIQDSDTTRVCEYISTSLHSRLELTIDAYDAEPANVRRVLRRQILNTLNPTLECLVCTFSGEQAFIKALSSLPLETILFTLGRLYDEAHVTLCKTNAAARKNQPHNEGFKRGRRINLKSLTAGLRHDISRFDDQIILEPDVNRNDTLTAKWKRVIPMSFDNLPQLPDLFDLLPGEREFSHEYAGIGGGGGSDIISASLLGRLLRGHGKEMNTLISTRTWATGSQGKAGAKMGVKREVHNGGQVSSDGKDVPGTFRVNTDTYAEGRDLEAIPLSFHEKIFMVLDQGESKAAIPESEKAELSEQFAAVISQSEKAIETVITVDTGGDVFGADTTNTTPDQDLRVQAAIATLESKYNLITAVVAPGVDAPASAPEIAARAGGKVYKPTQHEKELLLQILVDQYKMDGSNPNRFGKTSLALQARLKGKLGWHSLDLPDYVVDTWENPWNSFVYIRECMEDIVLMPTVDLLPLIEVNTG